MSRKIQDKWQIVFFCGWIDQSSSGINKAKTVASELTQPWEIFLCAGHRWYVPLTLASHLGSPCHRPQSRTTRETVWFWVCPSLLLETYLNAHLSFLHLFFPPSGIVSIQRSLSFSPCPCLQSFVYALPSTWNVALHLATSKPSVGSQLKCHFFRGAFFAPLN